MASMYAVTSTVIRQGIMKQIPLFTLSENVQGIRSEEHAEKIAQDIIDPFGLCDKVYCTAVKIL